MLENWLEWLERAVAVIASVLYLRELWKRKNHDTLMVGFLHGIKPAIEIAAEKDFAWRGYVQQINDMLERLQPPREMPQRARER